MTQAAFLDDQIRLPAVNAHEFDEHAIEAYRRYGAIQINGLLDESFFQPIQQALHERLALLEHQLGAEVGNHLDFQSLSQRLIALEQASAKAQSALYDTIALSPSIMQAASHPQLLQIITQLLSETISIHPRLILLMLSPGNAWHLAGWHQDWYYNEGPKSTMTAYIPLQHTHADNGSLMLALNDGGWDLLPHDDYDASTKWHTIQPEVSNQFAHVIDTEVSLGDVLLFHSMIPHCARLNQSDHMRLVANFRYRDLQDPEFLENYWHIGSISHAREALARKGDE